MHSIKFSIFVFCLSWPTHSHRLQYYIFIHHFCHTRLFPVCMHSLFHFLHIYLNLRFMFNMLNIYKTNMHDINHLLSLNKDFYASFTPVLKQILRVVQVASKATTSCSNLTQYDSHTLDTKQLARYYINMSHTTLKCPQQLDTKQIIGIYI